MKESGNFEKLPDKESFNPEKDLGSFLEELKEKNYFDSYTLKKMNTEQGNLFSCKIFLKRLSGTIENPKKVANTKNTIRIGFLVSDFEISTKTVMAVNFNKNSAKEEIEREIMTTIIKGIAQNTKGYSEMKRGLKAEQRVFDILNTFEKQKIIGNFRKADFVEDTSKKTDFVINHRGVIMPLQIKSSKEGQEKHLKADVKVPSLVIKAEDSEEELSQKIIRILESYTNTGEVLHI